MPGIALPVLNDGTGLVLPVAPSDPPSERNVARAALLHSQAINQYGRDRISDGEMARVAVYNHNVVESVAGKPAWLEEEISNGISRTFGAQPGEAMNLERLLAPIKTSLAAIQRSNAIMHNFLFSSSGMGTLEIVPFKDGEDPTKEPHFLPALTSLQSVNDLSDAEVRAYYDGYDGTLPLVRTTEACRAAILVKLGVVGRQD
ncbi:hypothetical protein D9615_007882 [Tricholomella constricta]|uniref:Mug135-like C-terminal domain-containing protein n=1 Tax=Tricholomella constricta TaxID=117010 RepID=A0A8H5H5E0_9AGAR|nr:hypothetical protein D9615_007882 [Tricholomella constricta]